GSSAELYDSSAGAFTATGDMTATLNYVRAVLLANGKVLIEGEGQDGAPVANLYDPVAGVFTATGSATRTNDPFPETATLLANGTVLLTLIYDSDLSNEAQIYDPSTGVFSATGKMNGRRGGRTATLLPDGTVLVAGTHSFEISAPTADLYNPATGTFSLT